MLIKKKKERKKDGQYYNANKGKLQSDKTYAFYNGGKKITT